MQSKNIKINKVNKTKTLETKKFKVIKRRKVSMLKLFGLVAIICIILFCIYKSTTFMYGETSNYISSIKDKYLANKNQNIISTQITKQEDKDIIKDISKKIELPTEDITLFARIKNPEILRSKSTFYSAIKENDYLVVYPSLAIIYDAKSDTVLKSSPIR